VRAQPPVLPPACVSSKLPRVRRPSRWGRIVASASLALATAALPARQERPLPAFEGWTTDGRPLSVTSLLGRRLLVVLFRPGDADGDALARAAAAVAPERGAHNFEILGVATGAAGAPSDAKGGFPVLLDARGEFASRLGLGAPTAAALLADAEGYVVRGNDFSGTKLEDATTLLEEEMRSWLRLGERVPAAPALGERPRAPDFIAGRLDGGERFALASLGGRPAVVVFFLHTCPHCHHALAALARELPALPEARRPELVAISVVNRPSEVRARLAEAGLGGFGVFVDPDESIRTAYGAQRGVPVLVGIDAEGRIAWRTDGWRDERDPALLRMRLALLAGERAPMLLHATGYSGDEFCATCHPAEHATFELTAHARAFDTLVRHGADRDTECVGCHVVGFGKPGGYDLAKPAPELEGVGCETCHGRGGPHLSPGRAQGGSYEAVCVGCHDTKHSLGFAYASFLPKVSHAALASLPAEQRQKRLAELRKPRAALLPTSAAHVGSQACRSCHAAEHERWAASPHAKAFETLAAKGKAGDNACRTCHTTGYGKGGFPEGGDPAKHADLLGVGCESCHGPGGDHAAPAAPKKGTVVSLADKCDSCVILQICGGCHDQANDPGFEYEVKAKIEAQRHGGAPVAGAAGARP
jgi:peroxiredoxin